MLREMHDEPRTGVKAGLVRRLGLFDLTLLVMGSIVGTSIFVVPQVVARDTAGLWGLLGAWVAGGICTLGIAFIAAELAWRRPLAGGSYVYLRDAYHPAVAFLYGWSMLLVIQSGSMASVAVIFARYFKEVTGAGVPETVLTTVAIAVLSGMNCLGVRTGSRIQSVLMLAKIGVLGALIVCGWLLAGSRWGSGMREGASWEWTGFGAAMVPIMFAYGGCQIAAAVAGEVKDPRKTLPRALIMGVLGVIVLYLGVNVVCARALGESLRTTPAPASQVMRLALGDFGANAVAIGIAISALGYLSQATLTTPRIYYAMASDGLFFRKVAELHPATRVPTAAILLQGGAAIVIAFSGKYHEILNYVMSVEMVFYILAAGAVFVFRRRDKAEWEGVGLKVPGHPVTTVGVMLLETAIMVSLFVKHPGNGVIGILILLAGAPVYLVWRGGQKKGRARERVSSSQEA